MQPEYTAQPVQMEHLFQAMSNMLLQVNHTNQSLLNFLSSSASHNHRPDPKIRPKSFSGLPTEDVLMWLDHFENVSSYHNWSEERKGHGGPHVAGRCRCNLVHPAARIY